MSVTSQDKSLILQEVTATCLLTNMQVLQHLSDRCSPHSAYNIKHLFDSLVMRSNKLCARGPWADWAPNQTDMKDTTRPAIHKGFTIVMIKQVVGEGAASIVRKASIVLIWDKRPLSVKANSYFHAAHRLDEKVK